MQWEDPSGTGGLFDVEKAVGSLSKRNTTSLQDCVDSKLIFLRQSSAIAHTMLLICLQGLLNDIILPEEEHVGLSILLVAGGVDNEVEAAKCPCRCMATFLFDSPVQCPFFAAYSSAVPVLAPENEREEEPDEGDVVAVVAADELDGGDGERAEEVAQADRADHLGHPLVARRQLAPHVVAALSRK